MFNKKKYIFSDIAWVIHSSLMGFIDKLNKQNNHTRNLTFMNFIDIEKTKINNMNDTDLKQFLDEKIVSLNKLNIPEFSEYSSFELLKFIDNNFKKTTYNSHNKFSNFTFINRTIFFMEDSISNKNKHTMLKTIESLEKTIDELIDYASALVYNDGAFSDKVDQFMQFNSLSYIQNYDKSNIYVNSQKPISTNDKNLIKNQLIFDILFDKYQGDIGDMTLNGYSSYMCKNFMDLTVPDHKYIKETYGENPSTKEDIKQINSLLKKPIDNLSESIKKVIDHSIESKTLGILCSYLHVDSALFLDYLRKRDKKNLQKRNKFFWDTFFYRCITFPKTPKVKSEQLITARRINGTYGEDSNLTYDEFKDLSKNYDKFVEILISNADKDALTYFNKAMAYYSLESIHRMDYIYKMAISLEKAQHEKIENDFIFSILFTPTTINIDSEDYQKDYEFSSYRQYYQPMLFHDNHYINQYFNSEDLTLSTSFHFNKRIRCLVYEMFNYYYKFESNNYTTIKSFIDEKYPILSYFDNNKIWNYSYGDSDTIKALLNINSSDIDKVELATINLINRMTEVSKTIFTG